ELKIAKLEQVIGNARILDNSRMDTSKVSVLSTVKIKNVKNGKTMAYTLVSEEEANLKENKISTASPFGKGLLGKKVGDVAQVNARAGVIEHELLERSHQESAPVSGPGTKNLHHRDHYHQNHQQGNSGIYRCGRRQLYCIFRHYAAGKGAFVGRSQTGNRLYF